MNKSNSMRTMLLRPCSYNRDLPGENTEKRKWLRHWFCRDRILTNAARGMVKEKRERRRSDCLTILRKIKHILGPKEAL